MAMKNITIKILEISASEERDTYRSYKEINGCVFSDPKNFVLKVKAEYEGEIAYFNHRVAFSSLSSKAGGCLYVDKEETDFVKYIEGETQHHMGGLRGDEKYFTCYGNFQAKIKEGDILDVRCQVEKKLSRKNNPYYQLKRVKLQKGEK